MSRTPQNKAEATLKQVLIQAPTLSLPDTEKSFEQYVQKKERIA